MTESVFDRERRIRNARLTMGQTFLLVTLNGYIRNNPDAWPSQTTIASAMNATCRAVRNWQTELEAIGVLIVEVGKGRSLTNRYRLNLEALPLKEEPRSALNEEPRSGFSSEDEIKEEPRSGVMRNDVPVNEEPRSYRKNKKEQLKEQAFSFPEKLNSKEFSEAWIQWTKYRREIKKKLTPSTITKQLAKLAGFGSAKAIRSIELSIENGWLGLFDPDSRDGKATGVGSSESLQAWQAVLDSLRTHSRYQADKIQADIGQRAWQAVKAISTLKKIDEANDFERRELQKRFIDQFQKQGAAA